MRSSYCIRSKRSVARYSDGKILFEYDEQCGDSILKRFTDDKRDKRCICQIAPSIQEAYRVTSQIAATLNTPLLEAVRQVQETTRMMAPAIREWQENTAQLANLMTPAIQAAAETAARMQIELQPLLRELRDVHPSEIQFTELFQEVSQYADNMDFSRDADEIDGLTEEEKQAAAKTVRKILSQPDNWEQRLIKSLTAAQESHPVFAKAII